jgi:serine O-acetyltransferase
VARSLWHRLQELSFWFRVGLVVPLLLPLRLTAERDVVRADARRWMAICAEQRWKWLPHERSETVQLLYLLAYSRAFRSILYYRTKQGGMPGRVTAKALAWFYRGEVGLALLADSIGPGLYVAHGFSTGVGWGCVVGENCWLHQRVTIGWGGSGGAPRIEDNVTIYTGAVVIGDITVGENAVIGANAVVTKDVPPGVVARGVPATYHAPKSDPA